MGKKMGKKYNSKREKTGFKKGKRITNSKVVAIDLCTLTIKCHYSTET